MVRLVPSPIELMRCHIDAQYTRDERQGLLSVNEWNGGSAPRFYLGLTPAGNVWRFRADLATDVVAELTQVCLREPPAFQACRGPVHRDEYLRILAARDPIGRVWAGPAHWFPTSDPAAAECCVAIYESNAELLRGGFEAWLPDVPHRQPFLAAVEAERAVSLCASVRITKAAHSAGIETLSSHRQQGYGSRVAKAWAHAVRTRGGIPFYSTSWENTASRAVAQSLGLPMFGVDFHVT